MINLPKPDGVDNFLSLSESLYLFIIVSNSFLATILLAEHKRPAG